MSELKCTLIDNEVHEGEFDCANESIEKAICLSYYSTLLRQTYGYKVCVKDIVVGYYMIYLKPICIDTMERIEGDEYQGGIIDYYTSAHIEYIAIDKRYQDHKIGTNLLRGIICSILKVSQNVPIRLITLDALGKYHEWYKKIGFRDIPDQKIENDIYPMYMDCMSSEEVEKLNDYYESMI